MNAYNITAPEEIAKKYGGNKKKIQQAAAQGLINPTEAVMAGMFIDRIRNAAQAEQAQQPTVAEQVMNPQPQMPPQGMAAMPQAQQMPQQAQMGAPQAPQMQQPQGMAMGGGLDSIPYNEGDYAEGGIVGFNVAGSVYAQAKAQLERQRAATPIKAERDKITAQLAQLEAEYQKSTYQPSLAAADLSTPTAGQTGGNRFNTGTLTEAEAERIEGRDMMDNVERGFGMFTDFVKSKLPSFGSDDPDEFAKVKNAQPSEVPGEEARQARVAAMTGRQPAGVEAIASPEDLLNVGMETFADTDSQRVAQTAPMRSTDLSTAAQQNFIAGLTPEQKAIRANLGPQSADQALAMLGERKGTGANETFLTSEDIARYRKSQIQPQGLNAIAKPMTADEAIAALGERKGTGANETFVQEQVQKTQDEAAVLGGKTDTTIGGVPVNMDKPAEPEPEPAGTPAERNKQMIGADETVDQYVNRMMGQLPKEAEGALTKKLKDRIANQAENMKGAKKDAMWMAVLETGVGMLAQGGGQTMFQALGKAAGPALKNYASTLKDIKAEDLDLLKHGVAMEAADKKAKAEITKQLVANFGAEQTARINRESQERIADERNKVLAEGYRIQAEAQNLDVKGLAALIAKDRKARQMPALSQNELYGLAQMTIEQNKNYRAQQQALSTRMPGLQQKANEAAQEAVDNFTDSISGRDLPRRREYDQLRQELDNTTDAAKQAEIQGRINAILEEVRTKARAQAMEGVTGQLNQAPSPLIIGTGADGSPIGSNPDVNSRLSAYPQ